MGARSDDKSLAGRPLSAREVDVVGLVVDGLTNPEIAQRLHITQSTAQAHVASAMAKLEARSRTQLAVYALRRGIFPLHPDSQDDVPDV